MILSRNLNRIGYVNREIPPNVENISAFLSLILDNLTLDSERGIPVTCFEIPSGLHAFDFSNLEEGSENDVKIWEIFQFLKSSKQRLFFFLPNYYFLGSQIPEVVDNSKSLITSLSYLLEQIGVKDPSIVVRVGSAYGARKITMDRFCSVIRSLGKSTLSKVAVCNDEKPSLFSVTDLLSGVYYQAGIPIVFRFLPHQFNNGGLSVREALFLAVSTWDKNQVPIFFHSESDEVDENGYSLSPSPSLKLRHRIPTFGLDIDVILDSSNGLSTCANYLGNYLSLKPMVINKVSKK